MKQTIFFIMALLTAGIALAQDSTGISYQAIVATEAGTVSAATVGVRLSILRDSATGTAVYVETQMPVTDKVGLMSLEIGAGNPLSGTFAEIDWAEGPHFIKSEIDPEGGSNYTITGTFQLVSVPFALHSKQTAQANYAGRAENVSFNVSGSGDTLFVGAAGQFVIIPGLSDAQPPRFPAGFVHCDLDNPTVIDTVISATGRIWMDRNLGASRVATASDDSLAYGDLYQWGRFAEGHQCRESDTTSQLATTSAASSVDAWYGKFVLGSGDWLSSQDDNLWQGLNGTNNPCPSGFRLPTNNEWEAEKNSWSSNNTDGAFASPLKLPAASSRNPVSGELDNGGSRGNCWSSSAIGNSAKYLLFDSDGAFMNTNNRSFGYSIRCIKNE